jgi:hypothetical protein
LTERDLAPYGLLGVWKRPSGNPTLAIYTKEPIGPPAPDALYLLFISRDAPLEQQGTITLEVVVTCQTAAGERGKVQELKFQVAPDPGSTVGYKIVANEPPAPSRLFQWDKIAAAVREVADRLLTPPKKRRPQN